MAAKAGDYLSTYWRQRRRCERAPSRADIDLIDLKPVLSALMLVSRQKDGRLRVRLAGTGVVRRIGWEPTGTIVDPEDMSDRLSGLARLATEAIQTVGMVSGSLPNPGDNVSFDGIDVVAAPLCSCEDGPVDQAILSLDFTFAAAAL